MVACSSYIQVKIVESGEKHKGGLMTLYHCNSRNPVCWNWDSNDYLHYQHWWAWCPRVDRALILVHIIGSVVYLHCLMSVRISNWSSGVKSFSLGWRQVRRWRWSLSFLSRFLTWRVSRIKLPEVTYLQCGIIAVHTTIVRSQQKTAQISHFWSGHRYLGSHPCLIWNIYFVWAVTGHTLIQNWMKW